MVRFGFGGVCQWRCSTYKFRIWVDGEHPIGGRGKQVLNAILRSRFLRKRLIGRLHGRRFSFALLRLMLCNPALFEDVYFWPIKSKYLCNLEGSITRIGQYKRDSVMFIEYLSGDACLRV